MPAGAQEYVVHSVALESPTLAALVRGQRPLHDLYPRTLGLWIDGGLEQIATGQNNVLTQ